MSANWDYGKSWEKFPVKEGEIWTETATGSKVAVHDIFDELPRFMRECDLIFSDPPYNAALLGGFYTKAKKRQDNFSDFRAFLNCLKTRIEQIAPETCYIEIGKQYVSAVENLLEFPFVKKYPVFYDRKNPCWIVRFSKNNDFKTDLSGKDELECIEIITREERYSCIGDLCMGRGAVGRGAFKAGRRFVGTELNKRRLAVLVEHIAKQGGVWSKK